MKYNESEEMYLETILILKKKNPYVRSIDVANELGYSRPSVSRGMKLLKDRGYIVVERGNILFTDLGLIKAEQIYDKHRTITDFLIKLGASVASAEANACKIEHVISEDIFKIIKQNI